jgi:hypothetical protein
VNGVAIGFVLWLALEAVAAVAWLIAQTTFLSTYQKRFGGFSSARENAEDFGTHPIRLLRRAPVDWVRKVLAQTTPIDEPVLEGLRQRMWRLFLAVAIWGFLGLPASLLLVSLARRVLGALGIG